MERKATVVSALALAAVLAAGCATSPIVPTGSETYMISQTSAGGVFTDMGALKATVIQRANAFGSRPCEWYES
jgi:hypothetical protein